DLQFLGTQVNQHHLPAINKVLQSRFESIAVIAPDGSARSLWGNLPGPLQLSPAEREHLQSGEPLIQVTSCEGKNDSCVALMRMTDGGYTVAGLPNADYVWAPKNLPTGFQFCVLSSSRTVLTCSDEQISSEISQLPAFDRASGFRQWGSGNSQYNAAFWKLLIGPIFLQQPW